MGLLLAVDAGTTSVKAGLFSSDGRCLGVGRQEYQLETPAPDRVQLDPEVYWQACIKTVRAVLKQSGSAPNQVSALAVSSQGETTITLDAHGRVIYPALVWLDNRATSQAALLARQFSQDLYARTGLPEVLATWSACKILWLKQNEPDVFASAGTFLLVQDYLIQRLTGRIVSDGSVSCTTMNYELTGNKWRQDVPEAIGIRIDQLPELVQPGTDIGCLTVDAAQQLGLTTRTRVVNGGMDQSVGAIGAGNVRPGLISESTGAALGIQATISEALIDKAEVVPVYCHSVPGKFLFVPVCPTAGMALKWLRDTFFQAEIAAAKKKQLDAFDLLTGLAQAIPAGSEGLIMLPHLSGVYSPEPNLLARGSFTGFTLGHTRGHFVRSLLEGVAFMLRRNLEFIEHTGYEIDEIISTGGGARSPLWNQIKADVCQRPVVTLKNEETALLGDAILAGVATGEFESIEAGCKAMVTINERILPGPDQAAYLAAYQLYCNLDGQLADYFKKGYAAKNIISENES